jgi:Flp pilus assembly protein TadD
MTRTHPYVIAARLVLPIALGALLHADVRSNRWIKLSTPHVDLYTSGEEAQAVRAVQVLEQTRMFFARSAFGQTLPTTRLKVLVCGGEADCDRYDVNRGAYAYYQRSLKSDYIVLHDLDPAHNNVAIHEYTHFVLEHSGLKLPLWLKEGMADLYSSLESRGRQSVLGTALPGRTLALQNLPPLDLERIVAVDRGSPYYLQPEKMQVFYAQSWVLTHMLALEDTYSREFPRFLSMISEGRTPQECFRLVYGKSLQEVNADLRLYRRLERLPVRVLDVDTASTFAQPAVFTPLQREVDQVLADLLASNPYLQAVAREKLTELSKQYPESPAFEESLGYLALQQNRSDEARVHFEAAIERQSADPVVIHYFDVACISAALNAAKSGKFDLAVATLSKVKEEEPRTAYELFYTLSYCHLHLRNVDQAKTAGMKAKQYARTVHQEQQAETLLRCIGEEELIASSRHSLN